VRRTFPYLLIGLALASLGADASFPRTKPLEPADAVKSFQVLDQFQMELLAAEPLVMDPVAAAYDEDGRLYVVEMSDYPHVDAKNDKPFSENLGDPPIGRVRLLIDRDGDGKFDEGHIFADKLSWPTGIAVWKGGVFVAATPNLWYLRDTDGDHKADERKTIFTGFRKYNVQAVMNNLQWGLDHLIYGAGSSNGGKVYHAGHSSDEGQDTLRRDFRFDPRAESFEVISGGARFGNTFDDWGNRFLCNIRNPAQHVVLPAQDMARNPFLPIPSALHDSAEAGDTISLFRISPAEPWRELRAKRWAAVGKAIPRSELVGAGYLTSSSGVTAYRGDAYPAGYRGDLFLGEVANNLIHRMAVEPDGVTFKARRADPKSEFIASTDTWFRPVNFVNAPDGTLHVLDMYRETIEHPWSIPDDIRSKLDLRSGEDRGRIYRLSPPAFTRRPTPRLSQESVEGLVKLLEHPNAWHHETAHRLLFERQDKGAIPLLKTLFRESQKPLARQYALYALAGLDALDVEEIKAAGHDPSSHLREHAVRLAKTRLTKTPELRAEILRLADDPDLRVRFEVALALGTLDGEASAKSLAKIGKHDAADPWVRTAVLSSSIVNPSGLFDRLWQDQGFASTPDGLSLLRPLALVIGARAKGEEIDRLLASLSSGKTSPNTLAVLLGLGDGLSRARKRLADLPTHSETVKDWLASVFKTAAAQAPDNSLSANTRAEAITLLAQGSFDTVRSTLPPLVSPLQPLAVQKAALKTLASYNQAEVAPLLLAPWAGYTPPLRNEVVGYLLGRRAWIPPLLDAVKKGTVLVNQIPPVRRGILLKDNDPAIRKLAQELFGGEAPGPRAEAIARYKPVLEKPGDQERGRLVFERECFACHKLGERGHAVGPNLAGVLKRTPEEILVNVLDPNREVSPEFLEYSVALDDGRVVTGLVASETPSGVTLRGREAAEQTILRQNIEEIASTGKSLMPEGIEKTVSPAEMADLIAFLLRLQD